MGLGPLGHKARRLTPVAPSHAFAHTYPSRLGRAVRRAASEHQRVRCEEAENLESYLQSSRNHDP